MSRKQLARLATFAFALVAVLAPRSHAQQVAFTFDDLPAHSALPQGQTRLGIAQAVIHALHGAGAPPIYGFVNAADLQAHPEDAAVLTAWRAAGNPLGNHTWSHMNLNDHSVADFEAEILRNEPAIRDRMHGADWHWFRYPNLAEGNTPEKTSATRDFLHAHGYRIAGVTMSFGDYLWNEPYARCVAKGDTAAIAQLETAYLAAAADDVTYRRAMARQLFGHDIPYVLLMHIGAFDAHMLPRLLAQYRAAGFTFITLPQAESNPFYANDLNLTLSSTPDTLEAAMKVRNLPLPPHAPAPALLSTVCR